MITETPDDISKHVFLNGILFNHLYAFMLVVYEFQNLVNVPLLIELLPDNFLTHQNGLQLYAILLCSCTHRRQKLTLLHLFTDLVCKENFLTLLILKSEENILTNKQKS